MKKDHEIERYTSFLKMMLAYDGMKVTLCELTKTAGISSAAVACAKNIGYITKDNQKGAILKCNYKHVEPIMGRKLLDATKAYCAKYTAEWLGRQRAPTKTASTLITKLASHQWAGPVALPAPAPPPPPAFFIYITYYGASGRNADYATAELNQAHKDIHKRADWAVTKKLDMSVEWPGGFHMETIAKSRGGKFTEPFPEK